jgi:hypothetical protein
MVNFCNRNKIDGAIISLDQEKAFDRVDWGFMLRTLEKMNFGPSFCAWVKLLYTNIFSRVLVNGFVSDAFIITRGVRQGCPLSPLLYIIVAETISSAIKKDRHIDGFKLFNGETIKIFQYADDTSVIVHSDQALQSLFSLFEKYERASGAKLNIAKSHGLLFGSWKNRVNLPVQLNWSSDAITVLGCRVANIESADWDSLVAKLEQQLSLWKQRQLSFRGRALIVNTLGLSLFWYQATIFDLPKMTVAKINKIIFPFIWSKKREWMARTSVVQPIGDGGLNVVDVANKILSLRAVWLRRFFVNYSHPWSGLFSHHVESVFGQSVAAVLARDPIPAYLIKKLPPCYRGVLSSWVTLHGRNEQGAWVVPRHSGQSMPLEDLTASTAYSLLRRSSATEHRSVAKYRDWGINVQWQAVWASLHLWRFVRSVQDTAWLTFHGILPTADRLVRFGMRVDPLCFCGAEENLIHLFTSCQFSVSIIDWFQSILKKWQPNAPLLPVKNILFGFAPNSNAPVAFSALLGVLRHSIWLNRNAQRFDHVVPDVSTTLKKARTTFRFLVRMHKRHCPRDRFIHEWLADGVIGSLTEQDWIRFTRDFIT